MLGMNVNMKDNAAWLIGNISGRTVYNIGMPSHFLARCASNLKNALAKYNPSEFVVIETGSINLSAEELTEIIDGTVSKYLPVKRGKILSLLRENNFLNLLHKQLGNPLADIDMLKSNALHYDGKDRDIALQQVLEMMGNIASEAGTKLIIAYHPSVSLNHDGTLSITGNPDYAEKFAELCSQNGIYFLNMSDRFMKEYAENHILPYGFINTSVGKGHMNKYGHKMFAEEIYSLIQRIEAQS